MVHFFLHKLGLQILSLFYCIPDHYRSPALYWAVSGIQCRISG